MRLPIRMRRLRENPVTREMLEETQLRASRLIQPIFVLPDGMPATEIASLPGQFRRNTEDWLPECERLLSQGIRGLALFPCTPPEHKDPHGSWALREENLAVQSIAAFKNRFPELVVVADVALDPYTTHGHDGLLDADGNRVLNDPTVEVLKKMAVLLAQAGADWVAPSDMMDGRVGAIREALDSNNLERTLILAYAAKFASAYYGPFREAVGSQRGDGAYLDKKGYQLNPANPREGLRDALLDADEGADLLMVKPAGPYLDIISRLRKETHLPVAAYQVSGEYAQIKAAAERGWLDGEAAMRESLLAIRRAGADVILTYFADAFTRPDIFR